MKRCYATAVALDLPMPSRIDFFLLRRWFRPLRPAPVARHRRRVLRRRLRRW